MPLQDLTPQLRTRLNRVERTVGCFVLLAGLLVVGSLAFYFFETAKKRGWFKNKAAYFAFVATADGMSVGDPVKLMGFNVGEITEIEAMPADAPDFNVYVEFIIREPYYGYIWSDSRAQILASDLLGNRYLEVTKGIDGKPSYQEVDGELAKVYNRGSGEYMAIEDAEPYWIEVEESAALNERINAVISQVELVLPQILTLTNQIVSAVNGANDMFAGVESTITAAQPLLSNLVTASEVIQDPDGSLGRWLLPQPIRGKIETNLDTAQRTLISVDQSLTTVASNLNLSLVQLAGISSNLHQQVQVNSNILSEISVAITNADHLMQGLKNHWLLRSAFKGDDKEWKSVEIRR